MVLSTILKAQIHVFAALTDVVEHLPFPIRGIDSDNGSEFINDQLFRYCQDQQLTFTRSRSGNKNDGAHVEGEELDPRTPTGRLPAPIPCRTQNQLLGGGVRAEATAVSRRCAPVYGGAVSLGKYGWCIPLVGVMGVRR